MKLIKSLLFLVLFLFIILTNNSFAHDTDLYTAAGGGVEPNILIIFDNSTSMPNNVRTGNNYDYKTTYPADPDHPTINKDWVYWNNNGNWDKFKTSIPLVDCSTARTTLTSKGLYMGYTDSTCKKTSRTLVTGNWLNFYYKYDEVVTMPKILVAQTVITDFLQSIEGVRIGLMVFNKGDNVGGRVVYPITSLNDTTRQDLIAAVNAIVAETATPLAETLYEAGLYFQGADSYFNKNTKYTSPIQYSCQQNFVIYMTDGGPHLDTADILKTVIGDRDGDKKEPPNAPNDPWVGVDGASDYLDDVAKYLYDTDLLPDKDTDPKSKGKQNVITYTIGFDTSRADPVYVKAEDLLRRTAIAGNGEFFSATNTVNLALSFANIINKVLDKTSSFVAPIVPVSRMERTTSGDKIYLAFFKPKQGTMWSGNIKKYGVQQTNDPSKGLVAGDILDASGSKALDDNGEFFSWSKSLDWTTSEQDGGEVERGGVGEVLKNRTTLRNIYTLLPGDAQDEDQGPDTNTSFDLTHSWNAFTTTNSRLTASKLGVATDTDKDNLVKFVHGIDVWDDNVNQDDTDKRSWLLGSFLHSRPYILNYADRTVIYAGANDGMLHAFDDSNGKELWAFIPPIFLGSLWKLHTSNPGIFVDGPPKSYVSAEYDANGKVTQINKAILIFGLRRGGNYYYALDVTNPLVPKYLWRIYKNKHVGASNYYQDLGQTWSTPVIGKIADGTGEKWVAIFGGGYDEGQDSDNPSPDDIGRGVYMADVLTGDYVWGRSYLEGDTNMTYSIPSDITKLDMDGDGKIDRLYVGDMNGRMWRFDIGNANDTGSWTGKMIFKGNRGGSEKRKILYPPDVTLERQGGLDYEMLFFGTGDREDPKGEKTDKDILVVFKDKNASGTKDDSDLVNVTDFYSLSAIEQASKLNDIKTQYGWYIKLDKKDGEKCLSSPVVYYRTAYFTTFSPSIEVQGDLCFVGEGTAILYAVNYATGEAVFNFDLTNDVGGVFKIKSDRSLTIGTAIPSGVVMTVIGGKVTAYVGVGGGVDRPKTTSQKTLFPMHWKLLF